jgi:hypothetical protein
MTFLYFGLFIVRKFSELWLLQSDVARKGWGGGGWESVRENALVWRSQRLLMAWFSSAQRGKCQHTSNYTTNACMYTLSRLLLTAYPVIWRYVTCPSTVGVKYCDELRIANST